MFPLPPPLSPHPRGSLFQYSWPRLLTLPFPFLSLLLVHSLVLHSLSLPLPPFPAPPRIVYLDFSFFEPPIGSFACSAPPSPSPSLLSLPLPGLFTLTFPSLSLHLARPSFHVSTMLIFLLFLQMTLLLHLFHQQ